MVSSNSSGSVCFKFNCDSQQPNIIYSLCVIDIYLHDNVLVLKVEDSQCALSPSSHMDGGSSTKSEAENRTPVHLSGTALSATEEFSLPPSLPTVNENEHNMDSPNVSVG